MKHHGIKLVGILLRVALLLTIVFTSLTGCSLLNELFDETVKRYADINLYINNSYGELSDHEIYKATSERCMSFIPSYDNFEYREFVKGFYVFDGKESFSNTSISFVLELQFDNIEEYEQFVIYEHNRYEYTDEFNIRYNGYNCYIVQDATLTHTYSNEKIPNSFGMFCVNQETLIARYIYFRECEFSVDPKFNIVFQNTNCAW